MSPNEPAAVTDPVFGEVRANWTWMLALGLLMLALGVIGLGLSYGLTIISVMWFGVLAVIGGVAQLVDAFKCSGWKSVAAHVLLGLVYVAAGVVLVALPVQSAWWLTLFLAITLIVTGVVRAVMAFQMRGGGAAWLVVLVSALISVGLGVLIFGLVDLPAAEAMATPEAARAWFREWGWVIGVFVAVEFIVHGAALAALALAARQSAGGVASA